MIIGCDVVGGIVNGGDDEMGEEDQHGRSDVETIIMVVSKSTIGGTVCNQWQIAAEGTLGTPQGTCTRQNFAC